MEACLRVYNRYGRRDNKYKARIKILVNELGIDRYRELVDEEWERIRGGELKVPQEEVDRINAYFAPPAYEALTDNPPNFRRIGMPTRISRAGCEATSPSTRLPGYAIVNLTLKAPGRVPGDVTADVMDRIADLAERYSFDEIRVNHRQNLVLPDVRQRDLYELWQQLVPLELATPNLGMLTDIIACPGSITARWPTRAPFRWHRTSAASSSMLIAWLRSAI
jgi:sulfite reductase (NADPH) hemoprotein beta-component